MEIRHITKCKIFLLPLLFLFFHVNTASPQQEHKPVPCRIESGLSPNIHFMMLGDVNTSVVQGAYDPDEDKVILKNGKVLNNYFRDSLGIKYYQPLSKKYFPAPPCGWTSWYSYFYEINTKRIREVADFFSKHLLKYGFRFIQIDNGWQIDSSNSAQEIWSRSATRFSPGMDSLADYIHRLGFETGIWLMPQGTRDTVYTIYKDAFITLPDGEKADSEIGFIIDPTDQKGIAILKEIMSRLRSWGFTFFKFDAQERVEFIYDSLRNLLKEPNKSGDYYYRKSLETIRSAVGEQSFITGSPGPLKSNFGTARGAPFTGIGLLQGSRAHYDLRPTWHSVMVQYDILMWYYFMHTIAVFIDPDAYFVGKYIPIEHARAFATIIGLSGLTALCGDPIEQLTPERIDLIRCITPPADIRPVDLFPRLKRKHILDLKVKHLSREYDVIGIIHDEWDEPNVYQFTWEEMGWQPNDLYHVYDFWEKKYLGMMSRFASFDVPLHGSRVLTFMKSEDKPQLISTSRHITQGWVDLKSLDYDKQTYTYRGRSQIIENDPYELRFLTMGRTGLGYNLKSVKAMDVSTSLKNDSGIVTITMTSPETKEVDWEVQFSRPDIIVSEALPVKLEQNYPNPFGVSLSTSSSTTRINFSLNRRQYVRLDVYDCFGRLVQTLVNATLEEGKHQAVLNSSLLSSGMYYYRLLTAESRLMKTMIVIN